MSTENTTEDTAWQTEAIIKAARDLQQNGTTVTSTSQHIAGAFVLNRPDLLPLDYRDMIEAWDRLGDWQFHVRLIKHRYMYLVA